MIRNRRKREPVRVGVSFDTDLKPITEMNVNDVGKRVLHRNKLIKMRTKDGKLVSLKGVVTEVDTDKIGTVAWVRFDGMDFPLPIELVNLSWPDSYYRANKCVGLF